MNKVIRLVACHRQKAQNNYIIKRSRKTLTLFIIYAVGANYPSKLDMFSTNVKVPKSLFWPLGTKANSLIFPCFLKLEFAVKMFKMHVFLGM
jgi:hypothetical protein